RDAAPSRTACILRPRFRGRTGHKMQQTRLALLIGVAITWICWGTACDDTVQIGQDASPIDTSTDTATDAPPTDAPPTDAALDTGEDTDLGQPDTVMPTMCAEAVNHVNACPGLMYDPERYSLNWPQCLDARD